MSEFAQSYWNSRCALPLSEQSSAFSAASKVYKEKKETADRYGRLLDFMMFEIYESCAMQVSTAMKQEELCGSERDLTATFAKIRSDNDAQKLWRGY